MNCNLLSGIIDTRFYLYDYDVHLITRLNEITKRIDSLYNLENIDYKLINIENYLYKDLIRILRNCGGFIDKSYTDFFHSQVDSIDEGLFDIKPIEFHISNKTKIILLFGKVYTPERKNSYSGVLGVEDNRFEALIDSYKANIVDERNKLGVIKSSIFDKIENIHTSFNCLNVVKYCGCLNKMHLPISLFFSGGKYENTSALSNTYLFTNIYFQRYFIISQKLGSRFIGRFNTELTLDDISIYKILTLWLWGHDFGHFVLEDNFNDVSVSDDKYLYEIFHELWSDIFSLYLLKGLSEVFLDIDKKQVCLVFLCELLRYMRKGGFESYPDSASAIIIYRLFVINKILKIDKITDVLLDELFELFKQGSINGLKNFLSNTGIKRDLSNVEELIELDIRSFEIPSYVCILN